MSMQKPELATHLERPAQFWLVGSCAFTSMASMRICDAMLPVFARDFSVTPGQAAGTISAFALAYGLLQLFYGPLGDRLGKTRVIGLATLACTVGSVLAAMSPGMDWLVAARALSGAAAAGIIPLAMAWIGDTVPYEDRQAVLAQLLGATVFGMISGQWAGGVLAHAFGWRSAFWVLALLFCCAGVLLSRQWAAAQQPAKGTPVGLVQGFQSVLRSPWARVVLLVTAMEGAFAFSALAFIPSDLHLRFGLSIPLAGGLVALYGFGGLVYSRTAKSLLVRWREPGLAKVGGLCTGLAFITMALATHWLFVPPACLLAGFGFYALHNTLQTNATQMAPAASGTAVSLFASSLFLGQSAGIVGAAWVVDRFGTSAVFAVCGTGLFMVGVVFSMLLQRRGAS